ncbi:phage shock protein operon transcriptional activator [Dongshaea marina]|uniref:phage shock protein operon transcriptional activator n=1 Tax=Dongshaea marina TaxID=2047966 RepID=UPI000D3EC3A0|nr:phage shock protein operon transcriptional activator [Dongshaea marina]
MASANENNSPLLGESPLFMALLERVSQLAPLDKPALIVGDRGTGKEHIARRLHYLSERWSQPFISLNCASLNENLLESELFGHEAGAFTGANKQHKGRFERANGGTLFLDELATSSSRVQEKLLRVIEYGELERVGGRQPLKVDVRLVCATNQDLPKLAAQGEFRSDLLDRLAFDVLTLPPLRHRQQDILLLAEHFAIEMTQELNYPHFLGLSEGVRKQLMGYPWPGNIRELKNVIERSIYRQADPNEPLQQLVIDPFACEWPKDDQEAEPNQAPPLLPVNLKQYLADLEQQMIRQALQQSQFNQRRAAGLLGLSYHQLRGILRRTSPEPAGGGKINPCDQSFREEKE